MDKKTYKQLKTLYDYSQSLTMFPPRGDGAKESVALEIHRESEKLFELMKKQLKGSKPETFVETSFMLLELVERILLDMIGDGYTIEELVERYDL